MGRDVVKQHNISQRVFSLRRHSVSFLHLSDARALASPLLSRCPSRPFDDAPPAPADLTWGPPPPFVTIALTPLLSLLFLCLALYRSRAWSRCLLSTTTGTPSLSLSLVD